MKINIHLLFYMIVMVSFSIFMLSIVLLASFYGIFYADNLTEYQIVKPCIDKEGAIFKNELCSKTIRCEFKSPEIFNILKDSDCKLIEVIK